MSYSQVKKARFYVDYVQYLNSMGVCASPEAMEYQGVWNFTVEDPQFMSKVWGLTNYKPFTLIPGDHPTSGDLGGGIITRKFSGVNLFNWNTDPHMYGIAQSLQKCNYIALFGHNFHTLGLTFKIALKTYDTSTDTEAWQNSDNIEPIYNCSIYNSNYVQANSDGVCILGFDGFGLSNYDNLYVADIIIVIEPGDPTTGSWNDISGMPEISSISMGKYFDMPISPDVEISQSTTYETRRHVTKGGKVLSKPKNMRRPNFGNTSQFDSNTSNLSRSGKKSWLIKYSTLKDVDIMGYNENSTPFFTESVGDYDSTQLQSDQNAFLYNLQDSGYTVEANPDFFTNVIHLTQGRLPFIFQPDNESFGTSDFNICTFDQNSFEHKQVGHKTYETSLSITESW